MRTREELDNRIQKIKNTILCEIYLLTAQAAMGEFTNPNVVRKDVEEIFEEFKRDIGKHFGFESYNKTSNDGNVY
jgi:hypothetical protein